MAVSGLADFNAAMRRKAATISTSRKAKPNSFEIKVPVGEYTTELSDINFGKDKDDNPRVGLTYLVISPETVKDEDTGNEVQTSGQKIHLTHWLSKSDWRSESEAYDNLFVDMQLMGVDTADFEHDDVGKGLAELDSSDAQVLIEVKLSKRNKKFAIITGVPNPGDTPTTETTVPFSTEDVFDEPDPAPESNSTPVGDDDFAIEVGKLWEYTVDADNNTIATCKIMAIDWDNFNLDLKVNKGRKMYKGVSFEDPLLGDEVFE